MFCSNDIDKRWGETLFEIQQWPLEPPGWIGCAGWLVTQKAIMGFQKFLLPYFCLYH